MKTGSRLLTACIGALLNLLAALPANSQVTDKDWADVQPLVTDLNRNEKLCKPKAFQLMLAEANYSTKCLKLPVRYPVQPDEVDGFYASSPWFSLMPDTNRTSLWQRSYFGNIVVMGYIETTNYTFFFHDGRLRRVIDRQMDLERFDLYPVWAKTPSLVDSNTAIQLAREWLTSIDVDVGALDKKYGTQIKIKQAFFWNKQGMNVVHASDDTDKTMLPVFDVAWGNGSPDYAAKVEIFGPTKGLMELSIGDESLSRRPLLVVSSVAAFEKAVKAQANLPAMHLQPALSSTNAPPNN